MKDEKIKQIYYQQVTEAIDYGEAVMNWREQDLPARRYLFPSKNELAHFLMNRLRKTQAALRAATKHVKEHNAEYHHVTPERVIKLWEKLV
ncbi:MAG: hypothetical protein C5B59_08830 [Bacteroidetes bacterium]|nr:MAG: hypothetical protein C5B59_08830 [Bacteroidota bacterium]